MKEIWKPLIYGNVDLSDRVLISNQGRIYSLVTNKILKQIINRKGYATIMISLGSREKHAHIKVHRAVAFMFVDNPNNYKLVHHKDSNKLNNCASNLEWTTNQRNLQEAVIAGLIKSCKPVQCNETKQIFRSVSDATKWCGLHPKSRSISEYLSHPGQRKTAGKHPVTKQPLTWSIVT